LTRNSFHLVARHPPRRRKKGEQEPLYGKKGEKKETVKSEGEYIEISGVQGPLGPLGELMSERLQERDGEFEGVNLQGSKKKVQRQPRSTREAKKKKPLLK